MKRIITMFSLISITIIGLFLAAQAPLSAKSPLATATETMSTANQLYETGQFTPAAQAYQQLVDQGFGGSDLYYNLGNAYFKQGDMGRAILNYRRAEQLAPRDPDIETNLRLARAQIVDQPDETGARDGPFNTLARFTQAWFTLNELAIAALVAWIGFVFVMIAFGSSKKGSRLRKGLRYLLAVTAVVWAIGVVGLGGRLYVEHTHPGAVVVASEAGVTSGPGSLYGTEFVLHSGTEVNVLETRDNWLRLALPDGDLQGWVPADAVEVDGRS